MGILYINNSPEPDEQQTLYALSPTGEVQWQVSEDDSIYPLGLTLDGTLLAAVNFGVLRAIDIQGNTLWSFDTEGCNGCLSRVAIGADGIVYFSSGSFSFQSFYALNPDGSLKWSYNVSETCMGTCTASPPIIAAAGTIHLMVYDEVDTKLYAVGSPSVNNNEVTLTVEKVGIGDGTVTFDPPGKFHNADDVCGTACARTYDVGTVVTLTATPANDSTFEGWEASSCSGTAPCIINIIQNVTVRANFESEGAPPPPPPPGLKR